MLAKKAEECLAEFEDNGFLIGITRALKVEYGTG